jgi:Uncharacterized protein conserved in bacteria
MNDTIYGSVLISKNGFPVPVFNNGHAVHSRYDPVKEAEQTVSRILTDSGLFLVAGIGGGYLLRALRKRYPDSLILAAEQSAADIDFLMRIPLFRECSEDRRIIMFPVLQTDEMLLRFYLPGVYGSLEIIELQSWAVENPDGAALFRRRTAAAAKRISADYSVQAHFGRIWQRNIIMNLKDAGEPERVRFPVNKTALVAAAGPSLDATAAYIERNRASLYVIATDTAYGSFCRRGIVCDAVVSIDGQEISHNHFTAPGGLSSETLFVFDLCANPASVRAVRKRGCRIVFIHTGHPLSQYASRAAACFLTQLDAGSGTVTIAASDFALKAGFSRITVAGADFSYMNGKAYMKGTYLDTLYNKESTRLSPAETVFDKLLFRTPLLHPDDTNGTYTTEVLASYRDAFERWAASRGLCVENRDLLRICHTDHTGSGAVSPLPVLSSGQNMFPAFTKKLAEDFSSVDFGSLLPGAFPPVLLALLPGASSCRCGSDRSFIRRANIAYSEILRYTQKI